jgi:hypothetical protein
MFITLRQRTALCRRAVWRCVGDPGTASGLLWPSVVFVALTAASACGGPMKDHVPPEVSPSDAAAALAALDKTKIFFAHQSVGGNIIDGIKRIATQSGRSTIPVIEWKDGGLSDMDARTGFFAHARLGANGDPTGKTAAFVAALEGGLGSKLDVAFQKYCFVDITKSTDVAALFTSYRQSMARLHREFPSLTLVHVTTPLMRVQSGPRAIVKKWLGRAPDYYEDNITRERFNELMRREYSAREPLFDLAALEASRPGALPEAMQFGDSKVYTLLPEYTTDGGHLNEGAQNRVASELLVRLCRTVGTAGHAASRLSE